MVDEASQPLLDGQARSSFEAAGRPDQPRRSFELSSESTPLLQRRDDDINTYGTERRLSQSSAASHLEDGSPKKRSRVRWPTVISLALLTTAILAILLFAFAAPAVVKEYAQQAAVFKPTTLSIDSTTSEGVRARVQGEFVMDAGRVKSKSMRNFGRLATWIAREVETGESDVDVYLPEYGNVLVGNATVPSIKVNIRNGHHNQVDFLTDLKAGDIKGIHAVALDWMEGRLGRLSIKGRATIHLKSGLIGLGAQTITDTVTFEEKDFPALPKIDIIKLDVHDDKDGAMAVDVLLAALIDSPIALVIPPLGFEIMVPNCSPGDPYIMIADATTSEIQVRPGGATGVNVQGIIKNLPDELTATCPDEEGSPLDFLVSSYMRGDKTTVYIRGADAPSAETPEWIVDFLRSVTVPLDFTGGAFDDLIKNFTMSDTKFSLPDPFAEPGTPDSQLTVSGMVKVLINLPEQMNFHVDVPKVRALANVFYEGEQLGVLNMEKWQDANSTLVEDQDGSSALLVESPIKDIPLEVTDSNLLAQVVQEMLWGSGSVVLHVAATVDTKVSTGLGRFAVRGIPADGDVPVNTPGTSIDHLNPRVVSLELKNTTESSLYVSTQMNFTNPTNYSATIPFVDVLMLYNKTALAHIMARNIAIIPGNNTNVPIDFLWSPLDIGGVDGKEAGRALMSSVASGSNTSVTIKTHEGTFPSLPNIGRGLSAVPIDVPVPRLSTPGSPGDGDEEDRGPNFIQDSTIHIWSSTAEFTLFSPLTENSIQITSIDATAFYEKNEPIGKINYKLPFDVPPGISHTPRLPVDLVLGGVGYDALRRALGQSLLVDAVATVGIKLENYQDIVFYNGTGIGANVRI
ncbi:hypothetical protein N7448_001083 [Penicillium atrosanguineum]|uniref:Pre-rRNA processing protein n=1 Tax=Penicillium atrosanguineum TaxID=1132637 RepID=A0A9W9Q4M7_9EURO|nr:hypothetical protein N7448_001083 [Penicillium atrosanguineum]KAJ5324284.1 hypothetical protein N7476_002884 [Penicillium atrosanguineum]